MKRHLIILILSVLIFTCSIAAQTDPIIDFLNKGQNNNSVNQTLEAQIQEYFRAIISQDAEGIYKYMSPAYGRKISDKKELIMKVIREEFELINRDFKFYSIKIKPNSSKAIDPKNQKVGILVEFAGKPNLNDRVTMDGELNATFEDGHWRFVNAQYFTNSLNVLALSFAVDADKEVKTTPKNVEKSDNSIINGGVVNGKAISLPAPEYPPAAKAVGASGSVNVEVLVDENGDVISAKALSGHALLQPAAVNAAKQAKFQPLTLNGQKRKFTGIIVYNFNK
ncbi:MAG: energy transducer TonB [Pyrinomonadaceae bacterium]|nr:energy transducer TonB [Pyrinomonadaceae bacterium]